MTVLLMLCLMSSFCLAAAKQDSDIDCDAYSIDYCLGTTTYNFDISLAEYYDDEVS